MPEVNKEVIRKQLNSYLDKWTDEIFKAQMKFPEGDVHYRLEVKVGVPNLICAHWDDIRELNARLEDN